MNVSKDSFHLMPNNLTITRGKLTFDINQDMISINNIVNATDDIKHSKNILINSQI